MRTEPADVILVPLRAPRGRRAWTIKHGGRSYAIFDVGGELQVTDAGCPHKGGPLAKGEVRGSVVTCPWHWYSFQLTSGICLTAPGYQLRKYPVIERDGRSYAELPAERRRSRWSWLPRPNAR